MILENLPGASKEKMEALSIYESSDVKVILKNGYAATAAGNNGAINVWEDYDNKCYSCERMRHFSIKDRFSSEDIEQIVTWTKKALELIK